MQELGALDASTCSRCTAFRSTGTCGPSRSGRRSSTPSAPSSAARSGSPRRASPPTAARRRRLGPAPLPRTAARERVYWYTLLDLPPGLRGDHPPQAERGQLLLAALPLRPAAPRRHAQEGARRVLARLRPLPVVPVPGRAQPRARPSEWLRATGRARDPYRPLLGREPHPRRWDWFDTLMDALRPYDVCAHALLHPAQPRRAPDHTSPPHDIAEFAYFARGRRRYGAGGSTPRSGPAGEQ
jgi:hypothetical protein